MNSTAFAASNDADKGGNTIIVGNHWSTRIAKAHVNSHIDVVIAVYIGNTSTELVPRFEVL